MQALPLWRRALGRTLSAIRNAASWSSSTMGLGAYNVTDPRRKILGTRTPPSLTANQLARGSLSKLRDYSRQLERNNPTARACVDGLVALVVGAGIDLEPDTGDKKVDDLVRNEFKSWCNQCAVDGRDIFQLQGQGFRDVVAAGEGLWRYVILPDRGEAGEIPLSILPLEAEWLDQSKDGVSSSGANVQVGPILTDRYGRPLSYSLKNPDEGLAFAAEEVSASAINHFFEKRRSMQNRGEPWFSPIIETLQQERDLVDAELQAAVTSSSIGIAVTSSAHDMLDTSEEGTTDDPAQSLKIGGVARLFPGDDVKSFTNTRPSQQIMPFRQGLRGDTAAAMRVPQRYLDRDVSRANYSSMRADNLDTDRLLGPVREWYGHATIGRTYKEVLPFIAARLGIRMPRATYRLIPDGQPYVDPLKDAEAAQAAITAGVSTLEIEVGKRGGDWRKLMEQLKVEQDFAKALGVNVGADAGKPSFGKPVPTEAEDATEEGDEDAKKPKADEMDRSEFLAGIRAMAEHMRPAQPAEVRIINETRMDEKTAEIMGRAIAENAKMVDIPQTIVNVAAPTVNVAAPNVHNEIAPQPPALAPIVNVAAPNVTVAAPNVTVENQTIVPQRTVRASQQRDGSLLLEPQDD